MRKRGTLCVVLAALALLPAAEADLDPNLKRLIQIQRQAAAHLQRQSNYACLESVQRIRRKREGARPEFADAVHMEVAHIAGRELYSWPGAEKFENKDMVDLVAGGLMETGSFSGIARNLFFNKVASTRYRGREEVAGVPAHRYDFWMSAMQSGFEVGTRFGSIVVACAGSFWADAESLDLLRLEACAEDLPATLGLAALVTTIDYGRVRFDGDDLLIPQQATTVLRHLDGAISENAAEYTHCRRFGSSTRLLDAAPEAAAETPASRRITLPGNVQVHVRLSQDIDSRKARVGDLLSATVESAVKNKRRTLIPQGAVVRGRLRRLERLSHPYDAVMIGIEFSEIEFDGARARFFGRPEGLETSTGVDSHLAPTVMRSQVDYGLHGQRMDITRMENYTHQELPGVVVFYVKGKDALIQKGWRMTWRTLRMKED